MRAWVRIGIGLSLAVVATACAAGPTPTPGAAPAEQDRPPPISGADHIPDRAPAVRDSRFPEFDCGRRPSVSVSIDTLGPDPRAPRDITLALAGARIGRTLGLGPGRRVALAASPDGRHWAAHRVGDPAVGFAVTFEVAEGGWYVGSVQGCARR